MKNKICFGCFESKNTDEEICLHCGFEAESNSKKYPHALPCGTILGGKYVLGRVLGQGGFGITYIAQDYISKELVAIKEFFPEAMATRTQTTVSAFSGQHTEGFDYGKRCFLEEAKTLAEFIGNPNIVRVYSFFEENNTAYFVMEYVKGTSLKSYLKNNNGKISVDEAKKILFPVMDALSVVHSKGIIHRDISPDNIFITPSGEVKLIDFGAARYSIGDKSRSLDVVLKHGYAPKEQYTRRGRQGPYTDVYALGATFYRAITGKVPPDSIDRMDEDDLVEPNVCGVDISEEAEGALLKALSVQPVDRFQSMVEFKNALMEDKSVSSVKINENTVPINNQTADITSQKIQGVPESSISSDDNTSGNTKKPNRRLIFALAAVAAALVITISIVLPTVILSGNNPDREVAEIYTTPVANTKTIGDYEYTILGDDCTISGYTGEGGHVILPRYVDVVRKSVNGIDADAFRDNKTITSLSISSSIYYIDEYAFAGCDSLESITLYSGDIAINKKAFEGCKNLKTIYISDYSYSPKIAGSVLDYPINAEDSKCFKSLTELVVNGLPELEIIFESVSPLDFRYSEVNMGNHIAIRIEEWLLDSVFDLYIPDTIDGYPVEVIGSNAFIDKHIAVLYFPKHLTTIEKMAFVESGITTFYVYKDLKNMSSDSFYRCGKQYQCYYYGSNWDSIKQYFDKDIALDIRSEND